MIVLPFHRYDLSSILESLDRCHMRVEFAVGSRLASRDFLRVL